MNPTQLHLLLADDDQDDCDFFKEALEELKMPVHLTTVHDGVELMQLLLTPHSTLPHALFLDLNMPRKNGLECLSEIKQNETLKSIPIMIFTTSLDFEMVTKLYEWGAFYYIRKPPEFYNLKKVLLKAINLISHSGRTQPTKDNFVLTPHSFYD